VDQSAGRTRQKRPIGPRTHLHNNGSVQIKGLYFLNRFANKLLERGAIEPQLLRAKLKKYTI
jgi:hypothetical protein